MSQGKIRVAVVYAAPERQVLRRLDLAGGSTVMDAIRLSEIAKEFPDVDLFEKRVGIHGRTSSQDAILHDGDRVEIYRPLIADPKEIRQRRARQSGKRSKGV